MAAKMSRADAARLPSYPERPPTFHATGAPCRTAPHLFFQADRERGEHVQDRIALAKAICRTCTLQQPCLREAIANNERHGIWGGHTTTERDGLVKSARAREAWATRRADLAAVDAAWAEARAEAAAAS